MLQQARTAVEADRVKEELMNEISVGKGAVEETCILTVNKFILGTAHNHNMQITKKQKETSCNCMHVVLILSRRELTNVYL